MNKEELQDNIDRMKEIQVNLKELVEEADDIVRQTTKQIEGNDVIHDRARSYWIPHILMEVDECNEWVGDPMCAMWDTIAEMEELLNDEFPDEEEK
jgi:hypothetical protein